jgi:hypothetical protein
MEIRLSMTSRLDKLLKATRAQTHAGGAENARASDTREAAHAVAKIRVTAAERPGLPPPAINQW